MLISENGGLDKCSIEFTTYCQNEHLLAPRGSPPYARMTSANCQPLEPVSDNAAGLHAAARPESRSVSMMTPARIKLRRERARS